MRRRSTSGWFAAVALAAAALVVVPAAPPQAQAATVALRTAVRQLPTASEHTSGYTTSKFTYWVDADRDGCNTSKEVLISEAVTKPRVGTGCALRGGRWVSYYDKRTWTSASKLAVDHVVPLAEAWQSGAWRWNADTRKRFANDLAYGRSLAAVTATVKAAKGAKDAAQWLPPANRCRYVADWVAVKTRWSLSVDAGEKRRLTQLANSCANVSLAIPKAKIVLAGSSAGGGTTTSNPANPGDTKNCSDFATQAQAQAWFDRYYPYYGDVAKLDSDGDRTVCESLP